jgi:hypothetical protein
MVVFWDVAPCSRVHLFYLLVVYLTTLFQYPDYITSNERAIGELCIGKDVEGSGRGLI